MKTLYSLEQAAEKIISGKKLLLAADESLLRQLPAGDWIAGTIPYFMSSEEGGVFDSKRIFLNELPEYIQEIKIVEYSTDNIQDIAVDEFENGFSVLILPGLSKIHLSFANNAMNYKDIYNQPLLGWISGVDLSQLNSSSAKVVNGHNLHVSPETGIAMHCKLHDGKTAKLDIINLFSQGNGDIITFPESGFSASDCFINGKKANIAQYINENGIDIRLPLVADFYGVPINTSFQTVDKERGMVSFYAPVFAAMEYKIAAPIENYVSEFNNAVISNPISPVFTCNCILNYLYGELEGKKTGSITGPITFGEIAYQLLNQTLVYLTIE